MVEPGITDSKVWRRFWDWILIHSIVHGSSEKTKHTLLRALKSQGDFLGLGGLVHTLVPSLVWLYIAYQSP